MQYFDVEAKEWKPMVSLEPIAEAKELYSAKTIGNKLCVGGYSYGVGECLYCYDIENNVWEKHPYSGGEIHHLCSVGNYIYAICWNCDAVHQRYNLAECQWQHFAKVNITTDSDDEDETYESAGATVFHSKVYVLYGYKIRELQMRNAVLRCFDPARNAWEEKASTCKPHFGSSLFVVNGRIYVAGGFVTDEVDDSKRSSNLAPVELYDEENDKWSIVEQKHIPQNNLGAVEIEGRVYFIINKFPVDSGIRIPPGEVYPVPLGDQWENLMNVDKNAVLCYSPVKLGRA